MRDEERGRLQHIAIALMALVTAAAVGVAFLFHARNEHLRSGTGSMPSDIGPLDGWEFLAPESEPKPSTPGTEIVGILDETIIGLDFNLPNRRLIARRSVARGPYSLKVTDANGKTLERCKGGRVFDDAIRDLSHVVTKGSVDLQVGRRELEKHTSRVAEFTLQTDTQIEAQTYQVVVTDGPPRSVLFVALDKYFDDTTLSVELLEKLAVGCSALSLDR